LMLCSPLSFTLFPYTTLFRSKLFIARDRLGIKPLYYRLTPESLVFGSEIKVILEYPGARAEFRRETLPEYLAFGYLSGEETMYQDRKSTRLNSSHVSISYAVF